MKVIFPLLSTVLLTILATGCQKKNDSNENVISERFIHKYGYDVSKEEWESTNYPGQVITTMRNGVTITANYENNVLHGPTTYTFPHSQTIESIHVYENGHLIKRQTFSIKGVPQKEELFFSPTHTKVTYWYKSGTPLSVEEMQDGNIINAECFSQSNEVIAQIKNGSGVRLLRKEDGTILGKETYDEGKIVLREDLYPSGTPKCITPLYHGKIHGEKKNFAETGEPISIETYAQDQLDGLATYFQNGCKYLEIQYADGQKNGIERHYIDGETVVEETQWVDGMKHGSSVIYYDGISKYSWYYNNEKVSEEKYKELCEREKSIAKMSERIHAKSEL